MDHGRGSEFATRFERGRQAHGPLVFGLDPSAKLLADWGLGDDADGLERFVDIVVPASVGAVAVVKPQSAFYERHGWRGSRALARLVEECRSSGVLVLLDVKRGDVGSTNEAYAEAHLSDDHGISADAITVSPYLGLRAMRSILDLAAQNGRGVFVVTRSSNPEGRDVQAAAGASGRSVERELLASIAAENQRLAVDAIGPIGAVVGCKDDPLPVDELAAMNGLFLVPGLGAQGATVDDVVTNFPACLDRVLPSMSRSLLAAGPDVSALRDGVEREAAAVAAALG